MNTEIKFSNKELEELGNSLLLDQLSEIIKEECELIVHQEKKVIKGAKDGGITIALSIAGVALAALDILVSVICHWKSEKKKFSIQVNCGNSILNIENLSKSDVNKISEAIEKNDCDSLRFIISSI